MNKSEFFKYDPYKLIEEVKNRPIIWNRDDEEYRMHVRPKGIWMEIVTKLMESDANVSKSDMTELESELIKKWKGMRSNFRKYLANPKKTKRPYIYFKQLKFLLKNKRHKFPLNDTSTKSDGCRSIKTCRAKIKFKFNEADTSFKDVHETRSNDTFDASDTTKDVPQKTGKPSKTRPAVGEFVFANVGSGTGRSLHHDPDKMFLLSLLPHLKAVPQQNRLNVKIDLMEALRSASFMPADSKILKTYSYSL